MLVCFNSGRGILSEQINDDAGHASVVDAGRVGQNESIAIVHSQTVVAQPVIEVGDSDQGLEMTAALQSHSSQAVIAAFDLHKYV